ncbi:hypothetical protein ADICEAN_03439 [Cesiribacter andamanensis AMV16]|uniref:Carbohydrate-binding domain-containing protein n=2 Tax=Cesiribacter TaxID=1133570 RepID=M7MYA7_9BACT|nr:hypothetical protein ADICEAN_03439 [Cesiribacter andamanensis AMV16]
MVLAMLGSKPVLGQARLSIPKGRPIMVDGKFSDREWVDARTLLVRDSIRLYFKQTKEYVYIGIQPLAKEYSSGWIDLFVADEGQGIYNLHASRKLGERRLADGQWEGWKEWWTNEGSWRANYSRPDDIRESDRWKVVQLKDEGWEFQISKRRFSSSQWKIMFDISLMFQEVANIKYPAAVADTTPDAWLQLRL